MEEKLSAALDELATHLLTLSATQYLGVSQSVIGALRLAAEDARILERMVRATATLPVEIADHDNVASFDLARRRRLLSTIAESGGFT
jgi:hypothetical protein